MNWLVLLPILIPIITAILVFFAWQNATLQKALTLIGLFISFIVSLLLIAYVDMHGYLVGQVGSWPPPYGITLVADMLSAILLLGSAIVGFCVILFSFAEIDKSSIKKGFYPAFCLLIAGVDGALLTSDLFNLYVWFEVILISSFVLLTMTGKKKQLEGAIKYAVLNLIATLVLLIAIAFLYGISGTLNIADLANILTLSHRTGLITTISIIFLVSLGIKAALFPLFFWLPASYHTTSYSTAAVFSGLLSKVGIYAMIRIFTLLFLRDPHYLHILLITIADFTLVLGILCAIAQIELRRILSFTLISHIGYMLLGLAILTPLALIGSIFYIFQHMLVKSNLFLASGYINYTEKNENITKTHNLLKRRPFFSILFFISAFSLAGIPPLSGFWGKIMLATAAINTKNYSTLVFILLTTLLTIFIVVRIWQNMFLKQDAPSFRPKKAISQQMNSFMLAPIILMTFLILLIGLYPNTLFHLASVASSQILNPAGYINAVLQRGG